MTWSTVETQEEADALMTTLGGLHDGCIREAHLSTGHWVGENLSMTCPGNLDNSLRILFQRQFRDPSAVEFLFEELTRFNLVPYPDNYDSIIMEATLVVEGGEIYWSPNGDWKPNSPDRENETWISARKLKWRKVDWLGPELRYGPGINEQA